MPINPRVKSMLPAGKNKKSQKKNSKAKKVKATELFNVYDASSGSSSSLSVRGEAKPTENDQTVKFTEGKKKAFEPFQFSIILNFGNL